MGGCGREEKQQRPCCWSRAALRHSFLPAHLVGGRRWLSLHLLAVLESLLQLLQLLGLVLCLAPCQGLPHLSGVRNAHPMKVRVRKNLQGLHIILLGFQLPLNLHHFMSSLLNSRACRCLASEVLARTMGLLGLLNQRPYCVSQGPVTTCVYMLGPPTSVSQSGFNLFRTCYCFSD